MQKRRFIYLFVALFAFLINANLVSALETIDLTDNKSSYVLNNYTNCTVPDNAKSFVSVTNSSGQAVFKKIAQPDGDGSVRTFNVSCKNALYQNQIQQFRMLVTSNKTVDEDDDSSSSSDRADSNNNSQGSNNTASTGTGNSQNSASDELKKKTECEGIFGNINDDGKEHDIDGNKVPSLAYALNKVLKFIQFCGPLLVIIFTILDLTKLVTNADKDALPKFLKKSFMRIIYAVLLFVFPILLNTILTWTNIYGTCDIETGATSDLSK